MEQFIPILIAAIVFGYQAYHNYQKEQEKARKRNPGQRPPQQQREERPVADMIPPTLPAPEPIPARYQEYAGCMDEDQLSQQARQRARRSHPNLLKRGEVTDEDGDEQSSSNETGFDLREAVIHAVILDRPYK